MANDHKRTAITHPMFKKIFTEQERYNLQPTFFKGGWGIRKKGWEFIRGSENELKVFAGEVVITCRKIDPNIGPFK